MPLPLCRYSFDFHGRAFWLHYQPQPCLKQSSMFKLSVAKTTHWGVSVDLEYNFGISGGVLTRGK